GRRHRRRPAGRPAARLHPPLVRHLPVPAVPGVPAGGHRRDQPGPLRPPRGRVGAGRRLPHRVLGGEVRPVLPGRVPEHRHRLGGGHDRLPGRPGRTGARLPALALADPVVHGQGVLLHLHLHLAARHPAPDALRPADGLRLEGADPGRPGRGAGPRRGPGGQHQPAPTGPARGHRRAAGPAAAVVPAALFGQGQGRPHRPWRFDPMMPGEILKGLSVTFRSMFPKRTTPQYPEEKKPTSPRFHGRHQLNRYPDGLERCIGCELGAYACPAHAIYVPGADNPPEARWSVGERYAAIYQINYNRCIFCGLCIEACPPRALTMTNEYELSPAPRQGLVYDKPDLLAPVPPGAEAPPHVDAEDGPPTIPRYGPQAALSQGATPRPHVAAAGGPRASARYGPQASLSQESVEPVWALLRQQETRQADR